MSKTRVIKSSDLNHYRSGGDLQQTEDKQNTYQRYKVDEVSYPSMVNLFPLPAVETDTVVSKLPSASTALSSTLEGSTSVHDRWQAVEAKTAASKLSSSTPPTGKQVNRASVATATTVSKFSCLSFMKPVKQDYYPLLPIGEEGEVSSDEESQPGGWPSKFSPQG